MELLALDAEAGYYAPRSRRAMRRYGWRNGWWNPKSWAMGGEGLRSRHAAPGAMVAAFLGIVVLGLAGRPLPRRVTAAVLAALPVAHLGLGARSAAGPLRHRLAVAATILEFHAAYGAGSVASVVVHAGPVARRLSGAIPPRRLGLAPAASPTTAGTSASPVSEEHGGRTPSA